MFTCFRAHFRDKTFIFSERYLQAEHEFDPVSETGLGSHELTGKGTGAYGIFIHTDDDIVLHFQELGMYIDESPDP